LLVLNHYFDYLCKAMCTISNEQMEHTQRHKVILAIGSNCRQEENLRKATDRLERILTDSRWSKCLWTEPIGESTDLYLNVMVSGRTEVPLKELIAALKDIERDCGRNAEEQRRGTVRMDIDIMEFDGERMHLDDWQREYISTLYEEIKDCNI